MKHTDLLEALCEIGHRGEMDEFIRVLVRRDPMWERYLEKPPIPEDQLKKFVETECVTGPFLRAQKLPLWKHYRRWHWAQFQNRVPYLTQQEFRARMLAAGFGERRNGKHRVWVGLSLKGEGCGAVPVSEVRETRVPEEEDGLPARVAPDDLFMVPAEPCPPDREGVE